MDEQQIVYDVDLSSVINELQDIEQNLNTTIDLQQQIVNNQEKIINNNSEYATFFTYLFLILLFFVIVEVVKNAVRK